MKVLHIDTGENWRGGQSQIYNQIKYLPSNIENHLLSVQNSVLIERIQENLVDIPVHSISFKGEWDLTAYWKLNQLLKEANFDIIHSHDSHGLALGSFLSYFRKTPPHIHTRRLERPVAQNWFSQKKYQAVDKFIAISNPVKVTLTDCGIPNQKVTIIPDGVDLRKISKAEPDYKLLNNLGLNPNQPIIGNVGALTREKNQENFIRAASHIQNSWPEAQFLIAGDGNLRGKLKSLISNLQLENKCVLAGFQKNIISLIKTFDLFVFTSINEGLGSILLQVMGSGIPIIASDAGGITDLIKNQNTGKLTDVKNPESIAKVILEFRGNRKKFEEWATNAKELSEKYDYVSLSKDIATQYDNITD